MILTDVIDRIEHRESSIALTSGVPRWAQKRNAEYPRALKQGGVSENSGATFFLRSASLPSTRENPDLAP